MVLLILSEQFLTGLRNNLKNTVMSDVNIRHGCEVIHYLIHYNRDVMLNDATGFLFYNVSLMSKVCQNFIQKYQYQYCEIAQLDPLHFSLKSDYF